MIGCELSMVARDEIRIYSICCSTELTPVTSHRMFRLWGGAKFLAFCDRLDLASPLLAKRFIMHARSGL
jgi:hypothetical protein